MSTADYSSQIPQIKKYKSEKKRMNLNFTPNINLKNEFPYDKYLDCTDELDLMGLRMDIDSLSVLNGIIRKEAHKIIAEAITVKLEKIKRHKYITFQPDELILLIQLAEKYKYFAEFDKVNAPFFSAVSGYWLSYVAKKMKLFYQDNNALKYNFKFKYIVALCYSHKYNIDIGSTPYEKVITNTVEKNWTYLFGRIYHLTSIWFKILGLIILFTIIYGSLCIIKVHYPSNKKIK